MVEAGIAAKKHIIPKFLLRVASSMLCYKQYPLQDEYVQAAQQVIDKYQWMRAKLGQPTKSCLKNRTGFLPHFQVAITQRGMFSSSPSLSSDSEDICFPFSSYLSNIIHCLHTGGNRLQNHFKQFCRKGKTIKEESGEATDENSPRDS